MQDPTVRQGVAETPAVEMAIGRILEIARQQLGAEAAFVAQVDSSGAFVRFADGVPEAIPPNAFLPSLCRAVLDEVIPAAVPDSSFEPFFANVRGLGALAAVPLSLPDGSSFGVLACVSRAPTDVMNQVGSGALRVLSRAIGRLIEEHHLTKPPARHEELERIRTVLGGTGLAMVYQPIVDLETGRPVGFEALARFGTEPARTPDHWFAEAARLDLGANLEMVAVKAALGSIGDVPAGAFLSVNASMATVASPEFAAVARTVAAGRLAVELTDHAHAEMDESLTGSLSALGASGVLVATDAADAGFETLSHLLQLTPDIIKLDGILVRGIDSDPVRRALASTIVSFSESIGARVVGEAIQTEPELAMLRALGVKYGQGNLLAPPGPLG